MLSSEIKWKLSDIARQLPDNTPRFVYALTKGPPGGSPIGVLAKLKKLLEFQEQMLLTLLLQCLFSVYRIDWIKFPLFRLQQE